MRILLIIPEFPTWNMARSWSYAAQLGIEEGLAAIGADYVTIPSTYGISSEDPGSWLAYARSICAGRRFDQIWMELVHGAYNDELLQWIAGLAPVRIGLLPESLQYDADILALYPQFRDRQSTVEARLQYMTHALAVDEKDVDRLNSWGFVRAMWWTQAVPQRFVFEQPPPPTASYAFFHGTIYGNRGKWLENPVLTGLLAGMASPENNTYFPELFNKLNQTAINRLKNGAAVDDKLLSAYLEPLRRLRRECFGLWLRGLQTGCAVVNLPHFVKAYPGRIVEGMAAGRPVITWEIPDRPRNKALYDDGREILLYPDDGQDVLADHVRRLQSDPKLVQRIATIARLKLLSLHTIEKRVEQILQWIETGVEPDYSGEALHRSSPSLNSSRIHSQPSGQEGKRLNGSPPLREQMNRYYENLFLTESNWSTPVTNDEEGARWTKIARYLDRIKDALQHRGIHSPRLLDLGCGRGWLTNLASEYGTCEGIDPVAKVVEAAKGHFPHLRFYAGEATDILRHKDFIPYDVVVTSEVIEHVPRGRQNDFVRSIRNVLTPQGYVVVTTPRGEVFELWMQINHHRQPVEDWLAEQELVSLFSEVGFTCLGRDRIYVNLSEMAYVLDPSPAQINNPYLLPLYQVGLFQLTEVDSTPDHTPLRVNQAPSDYPGDERQPGRSGSSKLLQVNTQVDTPMVSVIVPTHNRPDTLTEAVCSVLNQTFEDFEIIVINDAGIEVAKQLDRLNAYEKIMYLRHNRNRGLAAARNSGIKLAKGKYIAYLDDDDIFYPNHLETLVTFLESTDYQVAYTDALRAHQVKEGDKYTVTHRDLPYSFDFDPDHILVENHIPVLCVIHERACIDKVGLFDERLRSHEDWDLWIRMSREFKFAHINETTAQFSWRTDGSTMTSEQYSKYWEAYEFIYRKYAEYTQGLDHLKRLQEQTLQRLMRVSGRRQAASDSISRHDR